MSTRAAPAALVLCALAIASAPAASAAGCPNEARRSEQGAAALPDCRAYEQVSPAAKDNGEPLGSWLAARAASDGERLAWASEYALPESSLTSRYEPGVPGVQYLSRRDAGDWSSENVIPPQSVQYGLVCPHLVGIAGWSTDLGRGVLADGIAQESVLSPGGGFAGEGLECGHDEPLLDPAPAPGLEERHKEGSKEGTQNLFLRADEGGSYALVNPTPEGAPRPRRASGGAQEYFPAAFLAASDDLRHVVFEEELPLTPQAEEISAEVKLACEKPEGEERRACWEGHDNLYEWSEAPGGAGTVSLVTILPDGKAVEGRLAGATRNNGGGIPESQGGTPPSLLSPNVANFRHAVSADGSRVFFEVGGFGAGEDPSEGALYVREGGKSTFQVDASTVAGQSGGGGEFMAASADGSKVFFSADASRRLTADTDSGSGQNLYQCELPQGEGGCSSLTDLTPTAPTALNPTAEAGVLGISGTNEGTQVEEAAGGSPYVYFVATGALTAPAVGAGPLPGQPNLFLRHGGSTSFIATLDGSEVGEDENGLPCTKATGGSGNATATCFIASNDSCDWTARGGCRFEYGVGEELKQAGGGLTARVSANGRFLAFNSLKPLTGYDNEDAASKVPGELIDNQIFLYDAATGALSCASCNPDPSVRPTAPASIREPAGPMVGGQQKALYPQRNLSDNGQLFFDSQDALLSADTNDARDIYEYQAGAVDPLQLISSGKSEVKSSFLDASPDGHDVFFITAEPLLGRDRDTAYDIYDARVGGGFPEPAPKRPCAEEAGCRARAASAPAFPTPATALFQGPGNESAPKKAKRCRRGKKRVVRKGKARCVRKHRKHRGRHGHAAGKGAHRSRRAGPGARVAAYLSGAPAPASSASEEEVVEVETAPIVVTEEATGIGATSAELHGRVFHEVVFNSPECAAFGLICHNSVGSEIKACWFEYATAKDYEDGDGSYDKKANCEPPPPYSATAQVVRVAAAITGLDSATTYHYRLLAENKEEKLGEGEDLTFTTEGSYGPPTIDAESYLISRQSDGTYTAALSAQINPHGYPTTCTAQYVSDAQFREFKTESEAYDADATALPCALAEPTNGLNDVAASATLAGLPPGARYHFRFLAHNKEGDAVGPDKTFLTFAVESFSFEPSGDLRAGGHPYELNDSFSLSTAPENPWGSVFPSFAVVNPKDIVTTLPPGLVGNPRATPRCTQSELALYTCSGAAQVGVLRVETNRAQVGGAHPPVNDPYLFPLYNLVPPAGVAAQLGAPLTQPVQAKAHVDAGLDPGSGYAVKAASLNTSAAEGIISVTATIWGVPHDPSHDGERICPIPGVSQGGGECPSDEELESDLRSFLRNPTSCAEPAPQATMKLDPWQGPGDFVGAAAPYPPMQGCDAVPFAPGFTLRPTTAAADSPAGLQVELHLPQSETCVPGPPVSCATGEADLRRASVTLPQGLNVNPSSADGLAGCSPAQVELHGSEPARCPDAAKIGTVEVETPLLDHPLRGGVYVATPHQNPFNSLLAIYIAVEDPQTGIVVKLAGQVEVDPATGQLTTTFDQNPQLPFEDFKLDFFAGPRAALRTPATCGAFTTTTDLTPWTAPAGADATPSDSFAVSSGPNGSPCVNSADQAPNSPDFQAGTLTPRAGAYSPFVLHLARADGSQEIRGVSATLPPGLTGKLAGVPYCSEQEIESAATRAGRYEAAHPDCPAASQVGTVDVAAGAGPQPFHVQGKAYLAGPYNGAPLSLAIVTPAVAGPFDLGTVVVKTALYVNPETAQIHAVSGPIPTMLEGIPLDVRSIAVSMDRPAFSLNPTSCEPMSIAATALSTLDQAASLSNRFQVGGCDALPFAPKLALSLKGPTKRTGHPALKAVLTAQPGEANIAAAQVTLPHSEFLDQGHIKTICTKVQFNEGGGNGERCPAGSVYGVARAETPLLDHPLEGPVYLRSSSHELPDLVVALGGQINVVLDGRVDSVKGQIRNTFEVVPDAPVSQFTLEMQGGAKGLLQNSEDICTGHPRAIADFTGQNGKVSQSEPVLEANCPKKRKKHRRHHKHHRHHR